MVLLLGLAGCALDSFTARVEQTPVGSGEPVVRASATVTAERTQAMLTGLGVNAVVERDARGVRVRCVTRNGAKFVLVLTEEAGGGKGELQTRATIEWEEGADAPLAVRILAGLHTISDR